MCDGGEVFSDDSNFAPEFFSFENISLAKVLYTESSSNLRVAKSWLIFTR